MLLYGPPGTGKTMLAKVGPHARLLQYPPGFLHSGCTVFVIFLDYMFSGDITYHSHADGTSRMHTPTFHITMLLFRGWITM